MGAITKGILCILLALSFSVAHAGDVKMRGAPEGNPLTVAYWTIKDNWDPDVCPTVVAAQRNLPDGSITAICNNGEKFLIFQIGDNDKMLSVALRCKVAGQANNC